MDGQRGMMKPIVASRYMAKAPKNKVLKTHYLTLIQNVFIRCI